MSFTKHLLLLPLVACALSPAGAQWHDFRGPTGDGIVPPAADGKPRGLPIEWAEGKNIVWKTPLHGKGASSPVVYGDQIWLTTADSTGKRLFAVCASHDCAYSQQAVNQSQIVKPPHRITPVRGVLLRRLAPVQGLRQLMNYQNA